MKEYIEKAAIIDLIARRYEQPELCTHEINSIPAADVVEVVHGRWIVTDVITCSECQHFTRSEFAGRWNYCPNCGARMDKEDEHD